MGKEEDPKAVAIAAESKDPKPDDKKDGKPAKDDPKNDMSEEDKKLKADVELCVERIGDADADVATAALADLTKMLKTATGTVTSIPKPLKFLRTLYPILREHHEKMSHKANKITLSDVLSLVSMTVKLPDSPNESLRYKLAGTPTDLASWGHEYQRHLCGEIAIVWAERQEEEKSTDDLKAIVDAIVAFMMKHSDEPSACDLLLEIGAIEDIMAFCDDGNFSRVCLYLLNVAKYLTVPEDAVVFGVVFDILVARSALPDALRVALALSDKDRVLKVFERCGDNLPLKQQLCFMCARHRYFVDLGDDDLNELVGNMKLSEMYLHTARDMDSLAPKTPDEVYKTHLIDDKLSSNLSSHNLNLASTFVNAFVNAGYGTDKLMTTEGTDWIYKNKEHRMMSASASLGLIYMWDHEMGLAAVDKYTYADDTHIKAGALLATGILMCGVRSPFDPAKALLEDHLTNAAREIRLGAIMGLGLAYSATMNDEVKELLIPLVVDSSQPTEIQCFAALALSYVFVGSCNEDISEACMMCLMEKDVKTLTSEPAIRMLILALGILFLCKREAADTLTDATSALPECIQKYTEIVVVSCAYAASGNVMKVQKMFEVVQVEAQKDAAPVDEPVEKSKDEKKDDKKDGEKKDDAAPAGKEPIVYNYTAAATLGVGLIAMGEPCGSAMARRILQHVLLVKEKEKDAPGGTEQRTGRAGVPLAMALLSLSDPQLPVADTLSKLSHDVDAPTSMNAILGLGLLAAGTNNARTLTMLRNLSQFYSRDKDAQHLFLVRLSQGLVSMGKGHLTLSPVHSDRTLVSPIAVAGMLGLCHCALDINNTLFDKYHFMMYSLVPALSPRMMLTVDEDLQPLQTQARVGTAVDVVAVAGKPKSITGFQTHNTPVLLQATDRAELATKKYLAHTSVLEGVVVLKENPEYEENVL